MARRIKRTDVNKANYIINSNTNFHVLEAYKNLRTNLLFALSTSESNIVVVTSSEPATGKSYTCANLSVTMALAGNRVLLIDADMRKPMLHKLFAVDNLEGLSGLLSTTVDIKNNVHREVAPYVNLITSGVIPPNPSELLGHQRMQKLLDTISKYYDYVFIDAPPVNVVSDAMLLAKYSAGVLVVARQRQTTVDELQAVIDKYDEIDSNILGVVVTDVSRSGHRYGVHDSPYGYYEYK
jgi:capsular exopolysaccharide synthesis family protein